MTNEEGQRVAVSRRIGAPAHVIFQLLADPVRHLELDGSGMLRGAATTAIVSGVGDVFAMKMYFGPLGDYEMNNHIVEYELNRRIGWEPAPGRGYPGVSPETAYESRWGHRWTFELTSDGPGATIVTEIYDCSRAPEEARADMRDGAVWTDSMARTLERLDQACTGQPRAK
jgi:hypothetical protein